jgi:DUF1680 family protein
MTQKTSYPDANTTQIQIEASRPEQFTVYLRIPAWADGKTRVSVNGKRADGEVVAGKFFAVNRTWKSGDRIEYEIGMPLRLMPVDPQTPQVVALAAGPLALYAVGKLPAGFTKAQLLSATESVNRWTVKTDAGNVVFLPFSAIADEPYRLYQKVDG